MSGALSSLSPASSQLPQILWNLASPIHYDNHDIAFSQSILIHEMLLDGLSYSELSLNSTVKSVSNWDSWIAGNANDTTNQKQYREAKIMKKKCLLLLQVLLYELSGLPLGQRLTNVFFPFLRKIAQEKDDDHDEGFCKALLDVAFGTLTLDIDDSSSLLLSLSSSEYHALKFSWKCRVLERVKKTKADDASILREWILPTTFEGMASLETLPNVITWLIPLLLQSEDCLECLWNKCLELIRITMDGNKEKNTHIPSMPTTTATPLVVSAILCTSLPSMIPIIFQSTETKEELWKFFLYLLQSGTKSTRLAKRGGNFNFETATKDQLLRRRGLFLIQTWLSTKHREQADEYILKFITAFETFEMEVEPHLIDQVWDIVADLCLHVQHHKQDVSSHHSDCMILTWDWISALLGRIFIAESPTLRKLGFFRLLNNEAGIQIFEAVKNTNDSLNSKEEQRRLLHKPSRKNRHAISLLQNRRGRQLATVSILAPEFVSHVLIYSWDTLISSIGIRVNYQDDNGRMDCQDMTNAFMNFLVEYVQALDENHLSNFVESILHLTNVLRPKTAVLIIKAVADGLILPWRMPSSVVMTAAISFQRLFRQSQVILPYRQQLLHNLARILSTGTRSDELSSKNQISPETLLQLLSLYVTPQTPMLFTSSRSAEPCLSRWVQKYNDGVNCWTSSVAAACAAAFCQLDMLPTKTWDPISPTSETEHLRAASIVLLAKLSDQNTFGSGSAASCLWPAIYKGFKSKTVPQRTNRALLILIYGCEMEILSGIGNGDLVIQQQMPLAPPPNIEDVIKSAIDFSFSLLESLFSPSIVAESGCSQTSLANQVANTFSYLIQNQLQVLSNSYPSSSVIFSKVASIQERNIPIIINCDNKKTMDSVLPVALLYASLVAIKNNSYSGDQVLVLSTTGIHLRIHDLCWKLLSLDLVVPSNFAGADYAVPTALSVYPSVRWGCLAILLPQILLEEDENDITTLEKRDLLVEEVFATAYNMVGITPVDALLSLFDTVKLASMTWLSSFLGTGTGLSTASDPEIILHLNRIIDTVFSVLTDMDMSNSYTYILNETCALLFQPILLYDEYQRLKADQEYEAPIRCAFEKFVALSGTSRPHIMHAALRHIGVGWLGDKAAKVPAGFGAIPYLNSIAKFLVHKEEKLDISAIKQSVFLAKDKNESSVLQLPPKTDECSTARGYILVFFSCLSPFDSASIHHANYYIEVVEKLLHPLILRILREFCFSPLKNGKHILTGTPDYSLRIRSWQALYSLSRFMTNDDDFAVVQVIVDLFFQALQPNSYGEIRYFMELFGIQLGRQYPKIVSNRLVQELNRVDLSLQHVTSLMILAGNLTIGRYQLDVLNETQTLNQLLVGVIPWLSSAQGFSRAIAQLLVYSIVPVVVDIAGATEEDNRYWYLISVYRFLEKNLDMKRLRNKLFNLFDRYNADLTVSELLSISVDEGNEADPEHVCDFIKKCLDDAYLESHAHQAPAWKQVQKLHSLEQQKEISYIDGTKFLSNLQRKIIPLDALNISHSTRQERLSRRQNQSLVICASLLHGEVPTLAGLARSAEIFAAESLVISDLGIVRMDSFQTISVTAGDWIPISECQENSIISWIQCKHREGYTIIGVDQTLSSTNISNFEFPKKTILLLGKEKEGIPIPFAPYLDHCIRIPPLGIIQSLNAHVSGAICIWEYSKQP